MPPVPRWETHVNRRLTGLPAGIPGEGHSLPWAPLPDEGDGPNGGGGSSSGSTDEPDDADDDATGGDDSDGNEPDPNEQRYQKARQEAAERRRELRPWRGIAKDYGLTPEQVRERLDGKGPQGDEPKVDADAIRREADRSAAEKANQRIVRAEVRAAAADLFADPSDAPLFVDLSKFDVDEDGSVDEDEIRDDLKAVLEKKPHLAKRAGRLGDAPEAASKTPRPDPSQGARGGAQQTSLRAAQERRAAELEKRRTA